MTKRFAALVALLAVLVTGALASPAAARSANPGDKFAHRPLDGMRYDHTHTCTGKAQRGALALRRWLQANRPGSDWGIYNCRTTHTGDSLSLHAEGRAIDWHLDARAKAGRRAGNKLVRALSPTTCAAATSRWRAAWACRRSSGTARSGAPSTRGSPATAPATRRAT